MLFDLIERLRQKSPVQKKRIAFLSAFSFSGLIFVVWLSVLMPQFVEKEHQEKKAHSVQPSPSDAVGQNIVSGWNELKTQMNALKSYTGALVSGTEHFAATSTQSSQEAAAVTSKNPASTTVSTTTEE